ncbi:hypothetical protein [Streptococcus gallolyticus]|uniref:hypothetical protein n=1 Tax=Streptococcus gallolyticus TaxID=315405 RepID=UPI0022852F07|nr:hypothetical protein [Streptococcus gallolyticus]MCY7172566.1 hypothetical protein [Streptococcus gallolyticus subsp. gallolyticus]
MEFEKENLKRKNDESKDALKSKYLKNQIFQLDLELSQVTDEDEKKRLEALRNVYVEKLQENKKRRLIRILLISPLVFLALIILYLVTAFNRETTTNNKAEWSPSTTATSTSTSSSSSSSSTSETKTSSTIKQGVPAELVGNWKTADYGGVILTISEDGTMTKNQSNYIVTERVSGYEEVAQGVYRFYPANGSDDEAVGALILGGVGGTYQTTPKFASGIYVKNGYIYPQFWTTTSSKFTYSLNTNLKLVPTDQAAVADAIDTKNLTTEQVEAWVLAIYASQNQLSDEDKEDYFVNVKAYDDNLVYASVRKNSDSKTRLALYRVNADGYLEQGTLEATNWSVVSTAYVE